jgi:hypothetical protein
MEKDKKVFWNDLRKLIFCIIVGLLFGRAVSYCQGPEELDSLYLETDQGVAKLQLPEGFTLEVLNKHEATLPSTLGQAEPDSLRSIPIPPVGVTVAVFVSAAVVGWLRRRAPS